MNLSGSLRSLISKQFRLPLLILLLAAFSIGYLINGNSSPTETQAEQSNTGELTADTWTCAMHPQIQQPRFGQCPICGMDLVSIESSDTADMGIRELKLSVNAQKLANIQTVRVTRQPVDVSLNISGKLILDETRVKYISAWVPGRIDRLFVDYNGTRVRKGDHLVQLYSPQLISAQEEFLQAHATSLRSKAASSPSFSIDAEQNLAAAWEKLKQLGLTSNQISNLIKRQIVNNRLTIFSPISGTVLHRNATEGMYVKTGERIYTVADLRYLWLKLDAYESDLAWLHQGQAVTFSVKAWPGETFAGTVSFIDPLINPQTRTISVRVNVSNNDGRLKPEMFAQATLISRIESGNQVSNRALAGKWVSPMHPEIVKDGPGQCDVCGMGLVRAEDLGMVGKTEKDSLPPLVIPATAVLKTGTRAVVYIEKGNGIFEGREIMLGSRAGDFYVVAYGLREGEVVVTNGAFKLDSDLQIKARPSMMNPRDAPASTGHKHNDETHRDNSKLKLLTQVPTTFRVSIDNLLHAYLDVQQGLSHDSLAQVSAAAAKIDKAIETVPGNSLKGNLSDTWISLEPALERATTMLLAAKDLSLAREAFHSLSQSLINIVQVFDSGATQPLYLIHCPMAFNNSGADWLQNHQAIENPYFGRSMFRCGEIKRALSTVEVEIKSGGNR
ncbi:MAG: efflux RND transporter periplasmic adaptor subunit [Calditrichia bacterium]